jgi:hypothetical protein
MKLAIALLFLATTALAVVPDQIDTFEDGTTQSWAAGPPHPSPPANVPSGGPDGGDDSYLLVTSFGGQGAGNRLVALNENQWAGDYVAAGVGSISMHLNNLGSADLAIRLLVEDPVGGPALNRAITGAVVVLAGSGWVTAEFSLDPADMVAVLGTVDGALHGATVLRLFHGPAPAYPGPPIAAQLGVDNIRAEAAGVAAAPTTLSRVKAGYR